MTPEFLFFIGLIFLMLCAYQLINEYLLWIMDWKVEAQKSFSTKKFLRVLLENKNEILLYWIVLDMNKHS